MNPISPFTAQLKWLAPEFSNGPVRHYIVQIVPMEGGAHPEKEGNGSSKDDSARRWNDDLSKMPWTVNVPTIPTTSEIEPNLSRTPSRTQVNKLCVDL